MRLQRFSQAHHPRTLKKLLFKSGDIKPTVSPGDLLKVYRVLDPDVVKWNEYTLVYSLADTR